MKKLNILIDDNIPLLPEILHPLGKIKTFPGRTLTNQDVLDFETDILVVRSTTKVNENLLKNSKVRVVATATSGSEHLDKDYLKQNDIIFFDSIGSNALSVAEYCIFGILHWAFEHKIDIKNKIIGIIGYGNVGRRLAVLARHIGLKVIINDPPLMNQKPDEIKNETHVNLKELIASSDILSTHTPLSFDGEYPTFSLINEDNLKYLKRKALLLHTSRGGVVEEKAWLKLAANNHLTAIVDVWENEPQISSTAPMQAFIATPHIAGHSYDAKLRGSLMIARKLEELLQIKIDTSILEQQIFENKNNYFDFNLCEIYSLLKNEKKIIETSIIFKNSANENKIHLHFENMRKIYPKVREIFNDFLFNL
jgi:erythronate-4-phosphate dehydrogenase